MKVLTEDFTEGPTRKHKDEEIGRPRSFCSEISGGKGTVYPHPECKKREEDFLIFIGENPRTGGKERRNYRFWGGGGKGDAS